MPFNRLGKTVRYASRLALAIVASVMMSGCGSEPADPLVVATAQGKVKGSQQNSLRVFKGIPFAKAPVGERRWQAPEPVEAWANVRSATEFAPGCSQTIHPIMSNPGQPVSEDCLYLNVWTPAQKAADNLPVVVWIHGGGFSYGSTAMSLFDGTAIAERDVVFVSIAYRLGPLGFFSHPELSAESEHNASGNYALMDQVAGLKWVQENIAAFGGDPQKVTIMGESAGGMSVSLMAQTPLASGLFRGVISQSGASVVNTGMMASLAEAEQAGVTLMKNAGASSLAELRKLPAEVIVNAATATSGFTRSSSWPTIDGYVITKDPTALYQQGEQNDVALLIGLNEYEGALFNTIKTADEFKAMVNQRYGDKASQVLAAYPAEDDNQAVASAIDYGTDSTFAIQAWSWARLQKRHGDTPVYYYHFNHNPPVRPGVPQGAIHGAELPYMLGTQHTRDIGWTADDKAMSALMISYWTNFIKTLDPNSSKLTSWPEYNEQSEQVLLFENGGSMAVTLPHKTRMTAIDPLQ
ncbi:hypothetical protein BFC17_12740 [Alteromonas lipolytica]|uniref:Carboxylic ester hydrolase n=2 Tax=Alteromonas lipolytica TaxID=1856405 RepID=A0A1E8FID0_9ALTE|nr:hypothetical protein BFC17_12740 [Alteromonas lipolytica]